MEETPKGPNGKPYDLEERRFLFSQGVRKFVKRLPRTTGNIEDSRQLIRASGSVGANYIEANESLGRKDFLMKIRTCRKEAKESAYWLRLLDCGSSAELDAARMRLMNEARELMNIFAAILRKSQ